MAGREPVKRWGSINHEVSLLMMVMLASAIRLKQDKVLEEMPSNHLWCRFFIFPLISIARTPPC